MSLAVLTSARCLTEELGSFTRGNLFFSARNSLSSAKMHSKLLSTTLKGFFTLLSQKHLWGSHCSLAHF